MPTAQDLANAIRLLSLDAVERANSGHPGMPMGMADIAEVLWNHFLRHNPNNPHWANRDRFVLSNGHGSMLLYALLHLTGYQVTLDDLRQFRQLHSKTPGHPEYGLTPGVETTTGPLGQGLANAVGMALAERALAATFNRPEFPIIDHYTYAFIGDGCLMEGISHEACSLAGMQKLGKLIVFYDDNGISIDGQVSDWFQDDTPSRFAGYHWHVIEAIDGHDRTAISEAIAQAQAVTDQPSLLCCKTVIGCGAPNLAGTAKTHGAPLGAAEVAATREALGWHAEPFVIPPDIYASFDAKAKGAAWEAQWQAMWGDYAKQYPAAAAELTRRLQGELPEVVRPVSFDLLAETQAASAKLATRKASQNVLDRMGPHLPELLGGSADLTGSNLTRWSDCRTLLPSEPGGNYLFYGVREFAMAAIMNGLALHGGFIPYGGTFLVFSDYARNAIRLSALMRQRVIYVFSHDSIGLGEDGPTHQPVEHAAMLRLTPNLSVWRPADSVETVVAWQFALERTAGPTALLLSRQSLPTQVRGQTTLASIQRGGYVLADCHGEPQAILLATGSEVSLAMAAQQRLQQAGYPVRVVSMPSCDVFDAQEPAYRLSVLPAHLPKIAIEAASADYWYKYVGSHGKVIGLNRFGESAPSSDVYAAMGITVQTIIDSVIGEQAYVV